MSKCISARTPRTLSILDGLRRSGQCVPADFSENVFASVQSSILVPVFERWLFVIIECAFERCHSNYKNITRIAAHSYRARISSLENHDRNILKV